MTHNRTFPTTFSGSLPRRICTNPVRLFLEYREQNLFIVLCKLGFIMDQYTTSCLLGSPLDLEDRRSIFLWKVGKQLPDYTASHSHTHRCEDPESHRTAPSALPWSITSHRMTSVNLLVLYSMFSWKCSGDIEVQDSNSRFRSVLLKDLETASIVLHVKIFCNSYSRVLPVNRAWKDGRTCASRQNIP